MQYLKPGQTGGKPAGHQVFASVKEGLNLCAVTESLFGEALRQNLSHLLMFY